jgi:hypothetical protein
MPVISPALMRTGVPGRTAPPVAAPLGVPAHP